MAWVLKERPSGTLADNYVLGQVLGKGAFGTVYAGKHKKTGQSYAVKSMEKSKLVTEEDKDDVRREVQVLNLVSDHPHVAELIEVFEDARAIHLVLELCRGGELFDRVVSKGTFTERMAADYFRTMVMVTDHLHQMGVMHRDIKPENFLLTSPADDATVKLADFGLSTYFAPGQRFTQIVGSAYYVAPEVLRRSYGYEADMWSLGVILYILLSGLPPFWGDTEDDIFRMVLKADVDFKTAPWPQVSAHAREIVKWLLTVDVTKRPSAAEVLQHPWLKEHGMASDRPLDSVVLTRMAKFAAMNKLKKAALLVAARSLTEAEITGLSQLFKSIDTDNSGTITVEEMRLACSKMGSHFQDQDLMAVMHAADLDGNGTIDYEEFIVSTINLSKLNKQDGWRSVFDTFDTDHDGSISEPEIRSALAKAGITDEEMRALMDQYDVNRDGTIDYEEFAAMMRQTDQELVTAASFFREREFAVST